MNEISYHVPFVKRAKLAARVGFWAMTGGAFEGAERDRRRNRPAPRNVSQDADLNLGEREALMSEARRLAQTVPIVERILRQFANYVVGSCKIQFKTPDETWNRRAEKQFADWSKICDWRGIHNLRSLARLATVSEIRDGDFFTNEIDDGDYYFLEAIEGDRVSNARTGMANIDEANIVGGVKIGGRGEPSAYRVWDRQRVYGHESGMLVNPRDIPASQMIHLLDQMRVDAYRGVTSFKTTLNHIRDWKETLAAEKLAQKHHSRLSLIVKNMMGGASPVGPTGGISIFDRESNNNGTEQAVEEVAEGVIKYMFPGEDIQAFTPTRPGDGWFRLATLLIRDIAIGLDLPFEFVWDMAKLSGTATRLISKQAERTFENKQQNLEDRFLNRIGIRWVTKEMEQGRLPFNPDYTAFSFQRPAHPSVDAGRDSTADISEIESGVSTEDDIASERGKDGGENRVKQQQIARDRLRKAAELKAEFASDGITIQECLLLMGCANSDSFAPKKELQPKPNQQTAKDGDGDGIIDE